MAEKRKAPVDRYYSPQIPDTPNEEFSVYEPTPKPESVIMNKKAKVHKNNSCCVSCLLACFICCAVKGEDNKTTE